MDKIHISVMTGKLDGLRSISTNTVSNPFCQKMYHSGKEDNICTKCYSNKMLRTYRKSMEPALQRNSDLLSKHVSDSILKATRIMEAFIRVNAHGELINEHHLANIVRLAELKQHCNVTLWTKRADIVRKFFNVHDKPDNLILIFSNSLIGNIMKKPPKYFDKTFNNVPESMYQDKQNCTGQKCADCLLCYQHNGVDTIVEKVKKY